MDIEERLSALGLTLPAPPTPAATTSAPCESTPLFVGGNVAVNADLGHRQGRWRGDLERPTRGGARAEHLAAIKAALATRSVVGREVTG